MTATQARKEQREDIFESCVEETLNAHPKFTDAELRLSASLDAYAPALGYVSLPEQLKIIARVRGRR